MNTAEKVKSIIVDKWGTDEELLTDDAKFTDLDADSLDVVELIMAIEKEFDLAIPDTDAEKIHTVGDAIRYVEKNAKAIA